MTLGHNLAGDFPMGWPLYAGACTRAPVRGRLYAGACTRAADPGNAERSVSETLTRARGLCGTGPQTMNPRAANRGGEWERQSSAVAYCGPLDGLSSPDFDCLGLGGVASVGFLASAPVRGRYDGGNTRSLARIRLRRASLSCLNFIVPSAVAVIWKEISCFSASYFTDSATTQDRPDKAFRATCCTSAGTNLFREFGVPAKR